MRTIALLALFQCIFSTSTIAGPLTLLDCELPQSPVPNATVYAYMGRLILTTTSPEGAMKSRDVSEEELNQKTIHLVDSPEVKGVLYFRDSQWLYTFKGPNGWYMRGGAHCSGPYAL